MIEEWRPVKGYEGLYEVSNLGHVKSLPKYNRKTAILLRSTVNKRSGRASVLLSKDNTKPKRISVHRLVAAAFVENPNNYAEINHKDENPLNNMADNLEWCTRKYNMNYGTLPQRINEKNKKPVIAVNQKTGELLRFAAVRETEKAGFTSRGVYYSMDTGRAHKGFLWRYEDDKQQEEREQRRK